MEIKDTFSEGFDLSYARALLTAESAESALKIGLGATGYATSIIGCDSESGVDQETTDTPDGRPGVHLCFYAQNKEKAQKALIGRSAQSILTAPHARLFNSAQEGEAYELGKKLAYFGDGYEELKNIYGKQVYAIPVMSGYFIVENNFRISQGVSANLQIVCRDPKKGLKTAEEAAEKARELPHTITPFPGGVCGAGSKIGSKYSFLHASTNTPMCPSLASKTQTLLPPEAEAVYEIVVDSKNLETLKKAMKQAIEALDQNTVISVTAANFGGKLGKHKIFLREL